jgi:enterochelin esterase family protein
MFQFNPTRPPPMNGITLRLASAYTENERTLWLIEPKAGTAPRNLAIFLDGDWYHNHLGAPAIVEQIGIDSGSADTLAVFVSFPDEAARWRECPCYPPFADFIAAELLPWLEQRYTGISHCARRVLVGVSYTGLAAAYIALRAPGCFTHILAQSGSFWSNDCGLTRQYEQLPAPLPTRFYLDVGSRETRENVRHREDVLQVASQIEGVRRFRDVLVAKGHVVNCVEFEGGHDFAAWRQTLPGALRWALAP